VYFVIKFTVSFLGRKFWLIVFTYFYYFGHIIIFSIEFENMTMFQDKHNRPLWVAVQGLIRPTPYTCFRIMRSQYFNYFVASYIIKCNPVNVVLYGCETWSQTIREEHRLSVFENRVLRRIFGP
jgi:hypothetical protein